MKRLTIDLESRSPVDLKACGMYNYAMHPDTDIMCFAFKQYQKEPFLWIPPKFKHLADFEELNDNDVVELVNDADIVEAHNAGFERLMWYYVMHLRLGFPDLPFQKIRCSAAKASYWAFPRGLDNACKALGLPFEKDKIGYQIMMKMCKPKKPVKADREHYKKEYGIIPIDDKTFWYKGKYFYFWEENQEDFYKLCDYNKQDTVVEEGLSDALPEIPVKELKIWQLDQKINDKGVSVDIEGIQYLKKKILDKKERLTEEIKKLSEGDYQFNSVKQLQKTMTWLADKGIFVESIKAENVKKLLKEQELPDDVRRMLEIRQEFAKSSVSKLDAMERMACPDKRVRGALVYAGAQTTTRWSGKGIQPQNFPRDTYSNKDVDRILNMSMNEIELIYDNIFNVASRCLRGMIIPEEGKELYAIDFSSIEARVLAWLAGENKKLLNFRDNKPIYEIAASDIYGIPYTEVTKKQRQVGKTAELALGYQGWTPAFYVMAEAYGVSYPEEEREDLLNEWKQNLLTKYENFVSKVDAMEKRTPEQKQALKNKGKRIYARDLKLGLSQDNIERTIFETWAKPIIMAWRNVNPNIVSFWRNIEAAAKSAIENPGKTYSYRGIKYCVTGNGATTYLRCRIPSGRLLTYFKPGLKETKVHNQKKQVITYFGVDSQSKAWVQKTSYGGKLTENIVQATARDLLADALLRMDEKLFNIVFHVHDEIVVEEEKGKGQALFNHIKELMEYVPSWAEGLPLGADGWYGGRYQK
jgi:DNA polymerase